MNLWREVVICAPRRPANLLELRSSKCVFCWDIPPKFPLKLFFEILIDGGSKNIGAKYIKTRVVLVKSALLFKKNYKGKIRFYSVDHTKMLMPRFQNGL